MTIRGFIYGFLLYGLQLTLNSAAMADSATEASDTLPPPGKETPRVSKYAYDMDRPRGWILGLGFVEAPNPFVGNAQTPAQRPFPLFGYFGERLTWMGPMLSYNLFRGESAPIFLEAMTNLRFEGFKEDNDDPQLAGLEERDPAFELGFKLEAYMLTLSALTDVSGTHDGYEVSLSAKQRLLSTDKLSLDVYAATIYKSKELNTYYYGVNAKESTPQRPEYQAGSDMNYRMGLKLDYKFSKHWMLMSNLSYDWLSDEVSNSPIVERDYQYQIMAAVIYKFEE